MVTKFVEQIGRKEQLESGKSGRKVITKVRMWEGIESYSSHPKIPCNNIIHH
jgi:hypothetical protein